MLCVAADSTGQMVAMRTGAVRVQLARSTNSLRSVCSFSSRARRIEFHDRKVHGDSKLALNRVTSLAQAVQSQIGAIRTTHSQARESDTCRKTLEAAAEAVRDSTLHIEINPPVTSLVQSQLVLQALQRFGEVATFLNSKYNATNTRTKKTRNAGHSAIVIFESPQAAAAARAASPLTVPLRPHHHHHQSTHKSPPDSITVFIQESTHLHDHTIRHNPFYGFFPIYTDSIEVQDLIRTNSTYHSAPSPAFADCFTARKRVVPLRVKDAITRYNAEKGSMSLTEMWKKGLEERGEGIVDEDGTSAPPKETGSQGSGGGIFHRRSARGR